MLSKKSNIAYFIIFAIIILGKIALSIINLKHPFLSFYIYQWKYIILIPIIGYGALYLCRRASIPDIYNNDISNKNRIIIPFIAGLLFTLLEIGSSLALEFPNIHIPFPSSIPAYLVFGIQYEILYHFIPITIILWALFRIIKKDKAKEIVFWIFAIIISLYEPYTQIGGLTSMGLLPNLQWQITFSILIFSGNIIPIYFLKKGGLLSLILFRLGTYLLWHIIWPIIYFG